MATYKIIYPFEVLDKLKEGAEVCMVDRAEMKVACVGNLRTDSFASLLLLVAKEPTRFEFWTTSKTEDEE